MNNFEENNPLIEENSEYLKKIVKFLELADSDLNKNRVRLICWLAWRQSNEELHSAGVTRFWLRLFISRLFLNRANVAAADWRIERTLCI